MNTRAHLTPAESEALKSIEAAEAAGRDPFGDEDADETEAAAETEQATEASAEKATEQTEEQATTEQQEEQAAPAAEDKAEELDIDALAEIAGDKPASPQPPTYNVELPADLDTKRVTLMTEKAEALEKLMSGEIDAKEYAALEVRVTGELEALSRAQARAEALAAINQQNAEQESNRVIAQIIKTTKPVLDYMNDEAARNDFDAALSVIRALPSNASKTYEQLASEANRQVLFARGLQLPGKTQAAPAPQPKREVPAAPVTLRTVPAAATANAGGGVVEQMANLKGQAFEDSFAKLSPAQQAALLDD